MSKPFTLPKHALSGLRLPVLRLPVLLVCSLIVTGGCSRSTPTTPVAPVTPAADMPAPVPEAAPAGQSEPAPATGSIVGRKTREILNATEATADPNWIVITPQVSGSDPLSVAGTAYGRASTFAGSLGIVQWIKQEQALNGSFPSYAALMKFMQDNPSLQLPAVKDYEAYGYNDKTGEFVVLENRAEKTQRYKELGLPVE